MFFPNNCMVCGKVCVDRFLCPDCRDEIAPIEVKLCKKCGLPLKQCLCSRNFYYFEQVISCFENTGAARQGFYNFKFHSVRSASAYYAQAMCDLVEACYSETLFDFVCAVPMHPIAKYERGYNQAEVLARPIARCLKTPVRALLVQPKLTEKQHNAESISVRFSGVKGKYRVRRHVRLSGKTVLLVDDIKTTGATISECARQLRLAGAEAVYCVTALSTFPQTRDKEKQLAMQNENKL